MNGLDHQDVFTRERYISSATAPLQLLKVLLVHSACAHIIESSIVQRHTWSRPSSPVRFTSDSQRPELDSDTATLLTTSSMSMAPGSNDLKFI